MILPFDGERRCPQHPCPPSQPPACPGTCVCWRTTIGVLPQDRWTDRRPGFELPDFLLAKEQGKARKMLEDTPGSGQKVFD